LQWGPLSEGPEHDSGLEGLGYWIKYGKAGIDLLEWMGNVGQPVYKQVKGIGNAGPWFEGLAGGLLQAAQDSDDPTLSGGQKWARSFVVGAEDAASDAISSPWAVWAGTKMAAAGGEAGAFAGPAGVAVGAVGAGLTAYVGTNYAITQFLDRVVWDTVNSKLLPQLFP
jgi:hypothetical protein